MEKCFHHIFYRELAVAPEEHIMMLSIPSQTPETHCDKLVELLFETFWHPALYFSHSPTLSLYASGKTTGMVLEPGDGITAAVPVYEGHALPHSTLGMALGGSDITTQLARKLSLREFGFSSINERETVQEIKEMYGFVRLDKEKPPSYDLVTSELPDGTIINNWG